MNEFLTNLKKEIEANPDGLYMGKTAEQIANIINQKVVVEEQVEVPKPVEVPPVEMIMVTKTSYKDAPIFRVINGVPSAPNFVTKEDVIEALK